ncbi:uncharacterized protein ACA1_118790 [Acanthamoeba castellanii str. Neff]|uniref:Uncharacterized protein n=1 Tax=Acanthamoeba castellanii (strain ATCC 30010 / Neff) TaxID=1257118 RepID=L8GJE6_ACACF|nr:uncharacterized protein ACA1_118790 [Acanthamoeba castellanii str. Neff]ELR13175.1 hypothetical protein ACA1_118790 [Acanthamoeba castellanii str. Neff]
MTQVSNVLNTIFQHLFAVQLQQFPLKDSAVQFLIEFHICHWYEMSKKISESKHLVVTVDGTTKGHERSFLTLQVNGICDNQLWRGMVGVYKMPYGKTAREQAKAIMGAWDDLVKQQKKLCMPTTKLFKVCGISYDNTNNNQGNCGGVQVLLDQERERRAMSANHKFWPLIEKSCTKHTLSLCPKRFKSLVKLTVMKWKWLHLQAPADVKQYHKLFTLLMQQISQRLIKGSWMRPW